MGMFGKSTRSAAYEAAGLDRPNLGGQVLNQIGMNLLGVDFEGQRVREALAKKRAEFMGGLESQLGPQYSESPQVDVQVPDAGQTRQVPSFQMPQRTSNGLDINSPELGKIALQAQRLGVPITQLLDVLKAQKLDLKQATDGSFYNPANPALQGTRTANRSNVNNTIVDLNDPDNTNRVVPSEPVKGAMPVYDNMGRVVDWQLPEGARGAIQGASAADTLGRTSGTVFQRPNGDGSTSPTLGRDMGFGGGQGGAGRTQTPDDAAYAADLAKASATQYAGLQTAGQAASGKIATVRQIDSLLNGLSTGRYTPAMAEIQSAASSLGIKIDPKWGRVQAADALSNALTLQASGGSLGSGFSNADRDFQKSISPSAMQTPEGRRRIVAFTVAKAQREQQIAQWARQWQQGAGRLDKPDRNGKTFQDYLDAYAEAHPLMAQ
jgi:hypothetical protein